MTRIAAAGGPSGWPTAGFQNFPISPKFTAAGKIFQGAPVSPSGT